MKIRLPLTFDQQSQSVNHPTNHVTNDNYSYQYVLKWKNSNNMHTVNGIFSFFRSSALFCTHHNSQQIYHWFISISISLHSINECDGCVLMMDTLQKVLDPFILSFHNNSILVVKCFNEFVVYVCVPMKTLFGAAVFIIYCSCEEETYSIK